MSERITTSDVVKVAKLARLDLDPSQVERTTAQLAGMLEHFADIDALDLSEVEPMTQPYPLTNVFSADVVAASLDRDRRRPLPGATNSGTRRMSAAESPTLSALEIAAGVRAGTLKAADVLEQHLARIEAREPDVHAFNLV
ncbi:MAG TPA: Asp-tRNA(Asn)/Glu-tRNA(Gln) amidotransferase subunit GatC, partial [Ilumatobacteraceae bacterium]|nr:Asp-tRNA(Asn)/Glu-tRNA(Gln) amidotransferase subunit GatC [Ilumatobacteraceae bacterium]